MARAHAVDATGRELPTVPVDHEHHVAYRFPCHLGTIYEEKKIGTTHREHTTFNMQKIY